MKMHKDSAPTRYYETLERAHKDAVTVTGAQLEYVGEESITLLNTKTGERKELKNGDTFTEYLDWIIV